MKLNHLLTALVAIACSSFVFGQAPNGKKILVEKITSVGCPGCPWGGYILDSLAQADPDIIPVALHVHDPWHVDLMAFPEGDSILSIYKWGHPTLMVDRVKFADQANVAMSSAHWKNKIEARKLDPLEVVIGASTTYDSNSRVLDVTVYGTVLTALTGDIRINAYVVEEPVVGSGLGYDQLNGFDTQQGNPLFGLGNPILNYVHKWVTRDMLGGPWGMAGAIPNPVAGGTGYSQMLSTTLSNDWDANNCSVVVLVQRFDTDTDQRSILNAAQLGLNDNVLATLDAELAKEASISVYPNPIRDRAVVESPFRANRMQVFDLQGRRLVDQPTLGRNHILDCNSLPAGMYLLELSGANGKAGKTKILVRE